MSWQGVRSLVMWVAIGSLLALTGMVLLPHERALRYRTLTDGNAPTAFWIYRRIHEDRTPIDVAFIGTSRTGMSIHSARLEQDLAAQGIAAHVVNLHVVRTGRNMHYAVARELLENRKVKLLLIELTEVEDRSPHPDFIYLADTRDVLGAPLFVNLGFLSDVARLPGRQAGLFVDSLLSRAGLGGAALAPLRYEGAHLDHAEFIDSLDGQRHSRDIVNSAEKMAQLRSAEDRAATPPLLPASLASLEYRLPRIYLDRILALAASHDTRVAFIYLPRYGSLPESRVYQDHYSQRAPLVNPAADIIGRSELWFDAVHVNWAGAQLVTDQVARTIAAGGWLY